MWFKIITVTTFFEAVYSTSWPFLNATSNKIASILQYDIYTSFYFLTIMWWMSEERLFFLHRLLCQIILSRLLGIHLCKNIIHHAVYWDQSQKESITKSEIHLFFIMPKTLLINNLVFVTTWQESFVQCAICTTVSYLHKMLTWSRGYTRRNYQKGITKATVLRCHLFSKYFASSKEI